MAGLGIPIKMMAAIFGMSTSALEDRLKADEDIRLRYDRGVAKATVEVAETAFKMAVEDKIPAMIMFWLKCRANWKETSVHLHKAMTLEDLLTGSNQLREVGEGKGEGNE